MTARALLFLALVGNLTASIWAQGGACTQYNTWGVSGGGGSGSQPDYSSLAPYVAADQAQFGGVGPTCNAIWYLGAPGWSAACHSIAWTCAPPPPVVGGCSSTCTGGSPINLANGNTYIQETDVRLPGLGGGLTLTRTWNSTWVTGGPSSGIFGGWLSTYDESVYVGYDGTMKYTRSDGSVWSFAPFGNPLVYHLIAPGNTQAATLTEQGITSWTVTFENGEKRVFNNNNNIILNGGGPLSAIIDRNGNTTQLTYQAVQNGIATTNYLTTVTDPAGRHLYFTYGSPDFSFPFVTNVTSDSGTGINITYTYDPCNLLGCDLIYGDSLLLAQATQSDNTYVTFAYDSFLRITSVNDTSGKVLEAHTYGSGACNAGLSSSRANGVDALTIAFPNLLYNCSPGGYAAP
jgi:hypothetical protein